ncbi:MAG: hypothetical protein KJ613_00335, partial [Nanoarchaeota archaeon]|nr:hypothetical protein [Nanoarchaeota archaeon]
KVDSNYESKVLIEKENFVPVLYDPESYDELRTEKDKEIKPFYEVSNEESNLLCFEMEDIFYVVSISNEYNKSGRLVEVYKNSDNKINGKLFDEIMECSEYISGNKFFGDISNFKIVDSYGELGPHINANRVRNGNELDIVLPLK